MKSTETEDSMKQRKLLPNFRTLYRVSYFLVALTTGLLLANAHALWRHGFFGYMDLTIVTEIFSNGFLHGNFFEVADIPGSALGAHWSVSPILFGPFMAILNTQFTLLFLNVLAMGVASIAVLKILSFFFIQYSKTLSPAENKTLDFSISRFHSLVFFAASMLFTLNRFASDVAISGHYEPFAVPAMLFAMLFLLQRKPFWLPLLFTFFAINVREDCGFFFAFQLGAMLTLPHFLFERTQKETRRILALAAFSFVYFILALKVFVPHFGTMGSTMLGHFWGNYGNTPFEIVFNAITSPLRVLNDIRHSGFSRLNESVVWLGWIFPLGNVIAMAPGVAYFLAPDKSGLVWYNSAFFLPGLFLFATAGFIRILKFISNTPNRNAQLTLKIILTSVLVVGIAAHIKRLSRIMGDQPLQLLFETNPNKNEFDGVVDCLQYQNRSQANTNSTNPISIQTNTNLLAWLPNNVARHKIDNTEWPGYAILQNTNIPWWLPNKGPGGENKQLSQQINTKYDTISQCSSLHFLVKRIP